MAKYKVLSTKKLEPLLLEKAKEKSIEIIEQEFISIKPVWNSDLGKRIIDFGFSKQDAIALTSSNAAEILDRYMHQGDTFYVIDWKIFCLSGKTKKSILDAKMLGNNIVGEAENAIGLAAKIIDQNIKEIVFFCGNKRRDELPKLLSEAGVKVHEVVLYENMETPEIATDNINGVIFFSPSAVQSFFSINDLKKGTVCFAIGDTTANCIADFTDNRIITSQSPSQEMMMATVSFYFQNINCYE